MRWPWRRKRRQAEQVCGDVEEAARARQRAEEALARDRERTAEVRAVTARSRQHHRTNHFAQLINDTFRGPR